MDLPDRTHPNWIALVTGSKRFELRFVAAQILLGRVLFTLKADPSPEAADTGIDALRTLYAQNLDNPAAQEDLQAIFGMEAL